MRGTVAKRLRKATPMRPNPGRKQGGQPKMLRHLKSPRPRISPAIKINKTGRKLGQAQELIEKYVHGRLKKETGL